jgi:hypothetical protein
LPLSKPVAPTVPEEVAVKSNGPHSRSILGALVGLVVAFSAVLGPGVSGVAGASKQSINVNRAIASYQALQTYFYVPDQHLYTEQYPNGGNNPYSYVWPFSQAMAATIDLAGMRSGGSPYRAAVGDRLTGLEAYWNDGTTPPGYDSYIRPPLGGGGDKFYDDNEWIGLELVQWHRMTGDAEALSRARQIFDLVVFGWDSDTTHPCPGGVFWTQAPWSQDRNTVSNAPGAELGLQLYELTIDAGQKAYYFDWATKMYDWVNDCLLAPNGLYWDHIDLAGNIEKTQWSYNQGTMIGANALFYRITGQQVYLDRAVAIADAALAYYGGSGRLYRQDPPFNAIFFKNLLLLDSVNRDPRYRQAMQAYADEVWASARDPQTGLFVFDATKPVNLLFHAAMIEIYATLAWDRTDYPLMA